MSVFFGFYVVYGVSNGRVKELLFSENNLVVKVPCLPKKDFIVLIKKFLKFTKPS